MNYEIKQEQKFRFIEEGTGEPLVLLHGLFGALSNFMDLIEYFKQHYKVVVPMLPLFELDLLHTSVGGLEKFVHKFIEHKNYQQVHLLGNSLGGHVALLHALKHPERIKSLILTGSSGLFENGMGDTYPKRGDYDLSGKKPSLPSTILKSPVKNWSTRYMVSSTTGCRQSRSSRWLNQRSGITWERKSARSNNPLYWFGEITMPLHHRLSAVSFTG